MALTVAFALGYAVAVQIWAGNVSWPLLAGSSVVLLPITWTLVALRVLGPRPPRHRSFYPPGLAACLAVSAASFVNMIFGVDPAFSRFPGTLDILSVAALRAVQPLPLVAAVAGAWLILVFDRRWRPEKSWTDRMGRFLGFYWLTSGLILAFLRLVFV
jgi:hypothetical protein